MQSIEMVWMPIHCARRNKHTQRYKGLLEKKAIGEPAFARSEILVTRPVPACHSAIRALQSPGQLNSFVSGLRWRSVEQGIVDACESGFMDYGQRSSHYNSPVSKICHSSWRTELFMGTRNVVTFPLETKSHSVHSVGSFGIGSHAVTLTC